MISKSIKTQSCFISQGLASLRFGRERSQEKKGGSECGRIGAPSCTRLCLENPAEIRLQTGVPPASSPLSSPPIFQATADLAADGLRQPRYFASSCHIFLFFFIFIGLH